MGMFIQLNKEYVPINEIYFGNDSLLKAQKYLEEFRKEVMTAIEDFNTSEKEKNKMKGFFLRALKPHKAKIKLNLLDY